MHYRVTRWLKFTKKRQILFFLAKTWSKCTIVPENGGTPSFPHIFQIFQPRSLYHIPNVIIPTLEIPVSKATSKEIWNVMKWGWCCLQLALWSLILKHPNTAHGPLAEDLMLCHGLTNLSFLTSAQLYSWCTQYTF